MNRPARLLLCLLSLAPACGDDSGSAPAPTATVDAAARDASSSGPVADAGTASASDAAADAASSSGSGTERDAASDAAAAIGVRLPPSNGGLDYQLGSPYPPPTGVTIVSRDRLALPAAGLYNICYVNGFQAQTGDADFWLQQQPDLVLRDGAGKPVIDKDWNEMLLDVSTPDKRARLAAIEGGWLEGCAAAGFDAVEIDNLDSYARSGSRLTMDNAVAFIALLAQVAHRHGLAIAQKNSSELVARKAELGTDFVVSEECSRYDECDVYTAGYGEHVLMIEYRKQDFEQGCKAYPNYSIVLRDLDLVGPGASAYVFEDC